MQTKPGSQLNLRLWISRILIAVVLFFNLQAALLFIFRPGVYAPGFELKGAAGLALVQGMGVLFVMWNVPYAVALSHPARRRVSLFEAIAMQAIGLFGETFLLLGLPGSHPALVDSIGRFILFDGVGLGLLVIALAVTMDLPARNAPA